jgi:nitrogen regulatory protein P-II 1
MKEIKAIIQPFVADQVLSALREMPTLPGVTLSQVTGFGHGKRLSHPNTRDETEVFGVKKLKLEIVVGDDIAEEVVRLIAQHAHTGNAGDGKIFVSTVDDVVKIRTGERGVGSNL